MSPSAWTDQAGISGGEIGKRGGPASFGFESCPAHHRKVAPIGGQPVLKAGLAPQQGQGFDSFTFHHSHAALHSRS